MKPLLVVLAPAVSGKIYRQYLLESLSTGYRVHLLATSEPSWERRFLDGWTLVDMPTEETVDATALCQAAHKLAETEPVAGVLCWDEARVLQSAKVAAALGLPGGDSDAAMRCRDKKLTRQALAAAGVPQPKWAVAGSVAQAQTVAGEIGFPVVIKARAMAASLGVVRVDSAAELARHFAFARDTALPGSWRYDSVLVEEYLPDAEVSVDAAVHQGEVLPLFVARKELGFPPYFEEVGHLVDATDPLLSDDRLRGLLQQTHAALGLTDGMTHTELKLTAAGPRVVEVNARLGGGMIPYLGRQVSGIDPGLAAGAVACGQRPRCSPQQALVGAVRFFYVDHPTTIGSVRFDFGSPPPPELDRWAVLARPGSTVAPPPEGIAMGRIAFATAVAATADGCRQALAEAAAALTVEPAAAGARS